MAEKNKSNNKLMNLTAKIVASHVSNNPVPTGDLPQVISEVYKTLEILDAPEPPPAPKPIPAISIKKSITPDHIICLEDGRQLKMLKRHLKTAYNMTPDDYRAKWGLPADYPMVAPNYAKRRQQLAKKIGLGRSRKKKK